MNVLSIANVKFYVVEALMTGIIMLYLFIKEDYRIYVLIALSAVCILGIVLETFLLNMGEYSLAKVQPLETEEPQAAQPKSPNQSVHSKDGYFW